MWRISNPNEVKPSCFCKERHWKEFRAITITIASASLVVGKNPKSLPPCSGKPLCWQISRVNIDDYGQTNKHCFVIVHSKTARLSLSQVLNVCVYMESSKRALTMKRWITLKSGDLPNNLHPPKRSRRTVPLAYSQIFLRSTMLFSVLSFVRQLQLVRASCQSRFLLVNSVVHDRPKMPCILPFC